MVKQWQFCVVIRMVRRGSFLQFRVVHTVIKKGLFKVVIIVVKKKQFRVVLSVVK